MDPRTEHEIQNLCINYLKSKGFYVMRLNSGRMPYTYKGRRKFMSLASKGTPDVMAFRHKIGGCEIFFFEIKKPGMEPTGLQLHKMEELEQFGASCHVVHSLEEIGEIV